ncbi:MAG: rod-binding protein [Rubellimicrobium sp.]|nr:rod-binding protein [Rubellimicrobium sp.]
MFPSATTAPPPQPAPRPLPVPPDSTEGRLRAAATRLEAAFLAEMLKQAGLGQAPQGFGGGAGEERFASFLIEAQATELATAGGIGLAETLYRAMAEHEHDR